MNWYQHAHNPEAITSIFSVAPTLERVRLLGLDLSAQSGEATLHVELPKFPDKPSARWSGKGFTVAQVRIDFFGVRSLAVSGWESDEDISIRVHRNENATSRFEGTGSQCEIRFEFAAFRIAAINGYSYAQDRS